MTEKKSCRIKITPELREMIEKLKQYAVCRTDEEAVAFAIRCAYFEKIGQYDE